MSLTERQAAILRRMARRNLNRDGAESGAEMADALWRTGLFTSLEQGQRTCKQLEAKGLAMPLGVAMSGAKTWTVTDAGRAAAQQQET